MANYIAGPDKQALYAEMLEEDSLDTPMEPKFVVKHDAVSHPDHYTNGDIECIDAIRSATFSMSGIIAFCAGNAIKYIWRHALKGNPVQDLKKAVWYLEKLISIYELNSRREGKHE